MYQIPSQPPLGRREVGSPNTSIVSLYDTAHTSEIVAQRRAERLSALGCISVLETCVGPSLQTLETEYAKFNIPVWGNDIDPRWAHHYPKGQWLIGDVFSLEYLPFDAVVFAPPLSRGCTGKREDALSINDVFPRYSDFLAKCTSRIGVLVLPGRSMSSREDRSQFHELLSLILRSGFQYILSPMKDERDRITKYYDITIWRINA